MINGYFIVAAWNIPLRMKFRIMPTAVPLTLHILSIESKIYRIVLS
jgi:hypothetical protein